MTTVVIRLAVPSATVDPDRPAWCAADEAPNKGAVQWTPRDREHVDDPTTDRIIVPSSILVRLIDGAGTIDLEPGYWTAWERVPHGITRRVWVPDSATPIDYGDLLDADATWAMPEIDGGAPNTAFMTDLDGGDI